MLNNDKSKSIAIIVLGIIAVCNTLKGGENTVTTAIVGFIGGILVAKS